MIPALDFGAITGAPVHLVEAEAGWKLDLGPQWRFARYSLQLVKKRRLASREQVEVGSLGLIKVWLELQISRPNLRQSLQDLSGQAQASNEFDLINSIN